MKKNDTRLAEITAQIRKYEKQTVANVIKIGALLTEVEDLLEHGEFQPWVEREFAWSYRTSVRYRAAYAFSQNMTRGTFGKLNISLTALYILAELGDNEAAIRDAIINSGLDGKRLTAASVRDAIWTMRTERQAAEASDDETDEADEADADSGTDDADEADDSEDTDDEVDADDDADDGKDADADGPNDLALLLWQLNAFAADNAAWPDAINRIGAKSFRELIKRLETVVSRHEASETKAAVNAAADRAAAPPATQRESAMKFMLDDGGRLPLATRAKPAIACAVQSPSPRANPTARFMRHYGLVCGTRLSMDAGALPSASGGAAAEAAQLPAMA